MIRNLIALVVAVGIGAGGYALWTHKGAEESPLMVLVNRCARAPLSSTSGR